MTVTFTDISLAHERIKNAIVRTPIHRSRRLDEAVNAEVLLKCDIFQPMGAFKIRGAYNAMCQLSEEERQRGVITYSSGNHAQAIALSGNWLGVQTYIVMPYNAPRIKREATEKYGATVILYDPEQQDRKALAEELAAEHGYVIIPPYDHPHVIAGQGTAAKELIEDGGELDMLLVPCGGGGLLSGSAIATKTLSPRCKVIGIEPAVADDATRSFRTGVLHTVYNPPTIADGTRTPFLGELTFPLIRQYVDDMQTVTEKAIKDTVRYAFYTLKLVVEPSGALGLAALLSGVVQAHGKVGVLLCGGNIDGHTMSAILMEDVSMVDE